MPYLHQVGNTSNPHPTLTWGKLVAIKYKKFKYGYCNPDAAKSTSQVYLYTLCNDQPCQLAQTISHQLVFDITSVANAHTQFRPSVEAETALVTCRLEA